MYEEFYRFSKRPFSVLPDADFLYLSQGHRRALSMLEYGLSEQTGFTVITGEIGSGKTTLIQHLTRTADPRKIITHITDTENANEEINQWILYWLGVSYEKENDIGNRGKIVEHIISQYKLGKPSVFIIDEAQNLTLKAVESLRLISNINSNEDQYLKLILVGQPELLEMLKAPELSAFKQRISANFHLGPMSLVETREYIASRIQAAGGDPRLFDEWACDFVFLTSKGIPRQINIICDTALVYGYADGLETIGLDTIIGVFRDRADKNLVLSGPPSRWLGKETILPRIEVARAKEADAIKAYRDRGSEDWQNDAQPAGLVTADDSALGAGHFQVIREVAPEGQPASPIDLRGKLSSIKDADQADPQLPLLLTEKASRVFEPVPGLSGGSTVEAVVAVAPRAGALRGSRGDVPTMLPPTKERSAPSELTENSRKNGMAFAVSAHMTGAPRTRTKHNKGMRIAYMAVILAIAVPLVWLVVELVIVR